MKRRGDIPEIFLQLVWTVIFCPEAIVELPPRRSRESCWGKNQSLIRVVAVCMWISTSVALFKICNPWIQVSHQNTTQWSLQHFGLHISCQFYDIHIASWHKAPISLRQTRVESNLHISLPLKIQNKKEVKRRKSNILEPQPCFLPRALLCWGPGAFLSCKHSSHMLSQPLLPTLEGDQKALCHLNIAT